MSKKKSDPSYSGFLYIILFVVVYFHIFIQSSKSTVTEESLERSVHITSCSPYGISMGSGVLVDDGYILTAAHVVEDSNSFIIEYFDGTTENAEWTYAEPSLDLALIRVKRTMPGKLGVMKKTPRIGSRVFMVGCPYGILKHAVTEGIISKHWESVPEVWDNRLFITDAETAPGNSGGGVYYRGDLVGILVGGVPNGIGLCVPAVQINLFIGKFNIMQETKRAM